MPVDISYFRTDKGADLNTIIQSQKARGADFEICNTISKLDQEWRVAGFNINKLNQKINSVQKDIGKLMAKKENSDELRANKASLESDLEIAKKAEKDLAIKLADLLKTVGNIVHTSVPIFQDEKNNVVIRKWDSSTKLANVNAKYHHFELIDKIGAVGSKQGSTIAGHRGYFLIGIGVLLNQALINYGLAFLMKKQFTPIQPPFFMKKEFMSKTAQLSEFSESLYHLESTPDPNTTATEAEIENNQNYLIATSEQPISCYHYNEKLDQKQLPIRYAGISTCFRKEAGGYGRDNNGIFRVHQFEKVEQFVITTPENSWPMLETMILNSEEFYQSLGLSYHVISIVSGALNNAAAAKYDLEAWFPKMNEYRELVSCSNCTDYQSRALNTTTNQKDKPYAHFLNSTLVASERCMCAILENNQTEEGIIVPEVLRPYLGGLELISYIR
jgi:seryl-tRNA synthetase